DLAAAHGVGLAGDREWAHPGAPDAGGGEGAVDDGVDLVGAARRLVHPSRTYGDGALGFGEPLEEESNVVRWDRGGIRNALQRPRQGRRERFVQPGGRPRDERAVERVPLRERVEQTDEQRRVAVRPNGEVEVRKVGG